MSTFTDELILTPLNNGREWRLMQTFHYHVGDYPSNDVVAVPVGFRTDFASVPRAFWLLLPPWGKYGKAAVVHDYLCVVKDRSSVEVHKIFYEAMGVLGVSRWKRSALYISVKWFGPKFCG